MIQYWWELVKNPIVQSLILMGLTALVTHLFDIVNMKKSQSIRFQESLGEKVADALTVTREVVYEASEFGIESESSEYPAMESADIEKSFVYYPYFMRDEEAYLEFALSISEARKNYEMYLDRCSSAYLYVEERYLMLLSTYISKYGLQEKPYLIGTMVIADIQKWYKNFDRHLVRMMNRPHYKIYATSGFRWEILKKYMKYKYLEKSVLNDMIHNKYEPLLEMLIPDKKEIDNEEVEE